jgi:hypothetical protein
MKIIITESQLNEILKFNKDILNVDEITKLIEILVFDFVDFPICDIAVTKSAVNDYYMVLILTPKSSRYNVDTSLQTFIKKYIPVDILVLINETECDEFIN